MQLALTDATVENARHAAACEDAPSLPTMMSELERHEGSMDDLLERMDDSRAGMPSGMGMGHCRGESFDHMSETLDGLHEAMSDHVLSLRAAEAVDEARVECKAHTDAMGGMMHGMMTDLDSMPCMGR